MPRVSDSVVLLAYAEGNDLNAVAPLIRERLQDMVANHAWRTKQVVFVDQVEPIDTPGFLPDWLLGINLGLDHVAPCSDWFADVEDLVNTLKQIRRETERDFVLCIAYRDQPWRQEHVCYIGSRADDMPVLKNMIERLTRQR